MDARDRDGSSKKQRTRPAPRRVPARDPPRERGDGEHDERPEPGRRDEPSPANVLLEDVLVAREPREPDGREPFAERRSAARTEPEERRADRERTRGRATPHDAERVVPRPLPFV